MPASPIQSDIPEAILLLPSQVSERSGDSRLASADDARKALYQLLKEDEPRSYQRAVVKGCYDGNSPYNEKRRRQDGNGWMCNLNFQGLEGIVDNARIPYYGLFSAVPQYATFKTRYQQSSPDANRWDLTVADKFTCLLNRWRQFKWHIQASQFEMIFEGWGPLMFEDDSDWRFCAKPARAVLVPQSSPSCLDKRVPYIAIKCEYRINQLYDHIRDEEVARNRGWNLPAVQWAIKNGTRGQSGNVANMRDQPWEEWQKRYKNKEMTSSYTEFDLINCAHFFVQEYSGKISHFIISQDANGASGEAAEFLFRDPNRYDSYDQCLNVAFQNTGDGTWHSVRGVGLKAFKSEEVRNRLNCRMVDNAMLASGLILNAGDAKTNQKMQLRINGPISILPPGTDFVDRQMSGNIEGVMSVSRYLENQLAQKIGSFQQRTIGRDDGRGEQPTLGHVQLAAAKEGSLSAAQMDNYYLDLDAVYSEVYRRVLISSDPEARRFREDCKAAGVPEQALKDMEYVRANRLSGYGSPQMRKMAMQELMAIIPMMNSEGRNNALNELIGASQGVDKIPVFNPPMQQPDIDDAMAVIENDSLHNGSNPLVISGMDHVAHLQIHTDDAEERLSPLQQAIEAGQELDEPTLQQAFEYVSVLGEHCDAHLNELKADPSRSEAADFFQEKINMLVAFHGKLRSAIRSARARAEQAQAEQDQAIQLGILDQQKLKSEEQKMAIEAAKAQQGMQIKQAKATQQDQIKRFQAGQNARLDTVQAAEKIRLDRIKTAADVQNKKQKSLNGSKPKKSK